MSSDIKRYKRLKVDLLSFAPKSAENKKVIICIEIVYDHSRNTFIGAHESMSFLLGLKFPHVFFAGFKEKYLL